MTGEFTNDIKIVNIDGLSDFERIDSNLRALIVSIEGTIPGSRDFGLSGASINLRPEEARNAFYAELDDKVEKFIPEIRIQDVIFEDSDGGEYVLQINVQARD